MFKVNLVPVIAWMWRNLLLKKDAMYEMSGWNGIAARNHLVHKQTINHSAKLASSLFH